MARFHADRQIEARQIRRAYRAMLTRLRTQAELDELRALLELSRLRTVVMLRDAAHCIRESTR